MTKIVALVVIDNKRAGIPIPTSKLEVLNDDYNARVIAAVPYIERVMALLNIEDARIALMALAMARGEPLPEKPDKVH